MQICVYYEAKQKWKKDNKNILSEQKEEAYWKAFQKGFCYAEF